jgi:anti-anti-sigma regulatory factor
LTLQGSVDIFEAVTVHKTMLRALCDREAATICVHAGSVDQLDVSAVQLLLALRRDVEAAGRSFVIREAGSFETNILAPLGIASQP